MLTNVASGWDGLPDNALYDKVSWIRKTNLKQQNNLMGLIYKVGLSNAQPNNDGMFDVGHRTSAPTYIKSRELR